MVVTSLALHCLPPGIHFRLYPLWGSWTVRANSKEAEQGGEGPAYSVYGIADG